MWASADVLTPSRWARRECERRAEDAPQAWPRVLGATEEWLLWREAARRAAQGSPFLDTDLLAESLQRASARAAEYEITLVEDAAPESESALLLAAQRDFAARCRALHAASVSALTSRLCGTQRPGQLLLRPMLVTSAQATATGALAIPKGMIAITIPAINRPPDMTSSMANSSATRSGGL